MSHHQFFYLFQNKEPIAFPLEPLVRILEQFGCDVTRSDERSYFVRTPVRETGVEEIGAECGIHLEGTSAFEFAVERPYYDDKFFSVAAEVIVQLGLCMFSDAGTGVYIRNSEQQRHIHEDISVNATVIGSADELRKAMFASGLQE
jgi:hypothetical protein